VARHRLQLVLAAVLLAGALLCWSTVTSAVEVPPVAEGEPASVSVVYHPPLMALAWLLMTAAGVLGVLGVAGLRRLRSRYPYPPGV
jgi:hypothetical protein